MFQWILQRFSKSTPEPSGPVLTVHNNPYKARKEWPPDFSKLNPKHQFRYEKRYRRRCKAKALRPGWVKGVKLTANGSVVVILVYTILFMDWGEMAGINGKPFEKTREWFWRQTGSIWSTSRPPLRRPAQEGEPSSKS